MRLCGARGMTLTRWLKMVIGYMLLLMIPFGFFITLQGVIQRQFGYVRDGMIMLTIPFLLWNVVVDGVGIKSLKVVSIGYWILSVLAFLDIFVINDDVFRILLLIISISAVYGALHPEWALRRPSLKIK